MDKIIGENQNNLNRLESKSIRSSSLLKGYIYIYKLNLFNPRWLWGGGGESDEGLKITTTRKREIIIVK